ncbi:putative 5-formyltetrahydrofolate cyclo-ligase [bacterium BMS3Abin10]|nr:putative 5-formyltetrahydrofolate cyclo-ligase [bacterium BMS3Abin10]GBE39066.1 putative 5-formyltetrahydrofolate cyclo-ligase [bacterium BMS3Bbin08]
MKRSVREVLLKKRDSINPVEKREKEKEIRRRLYRQSDFKKAKRVLFYVSFKSEVDTMLCLKHAFDINKRVVLPRVNGRKDKLDLYEIQALSDLESGFIGILEPDIRKGRETKLKDIDLVIIPGAGFDDRGSRLGYGHGYYDKLLSGADRHIRTIALAFEEQVVPDIPTEAHDIGIDRIVTEKRIINCTGKRGNGV